MTAVATTSVPYNSEPEWFMGLHQEGKAAEIGDLVLAELGKFVLRIVNRRRAS